MGLDVPHQTRKKRRVLLVIYCRADSVRVRRDMQRSVVTCGMQTASTGTGRGEQGQSCSPGSVVMKTFIALLPSN